jgi:hypothetical protein
MLQKLPPQPAKVYRVILCYHKELGKEVNKLTKEEELGSVKSQEAKRGKGQLASCFHFTGQAA